MSARSLDLGCALPKNLWFFFCSARALDCCRFRKKQSIWEIKKHSEKTKFISRDKNIFPAMFFFMFFLLVFFVAFNNFFYNRSKVVFIFYFVALINFSRNMSSVFFIWSPSFTFPKICLMFNVFFLKCFFYRPPFIKFWTFFI